MANEVAAALEAPTSLVENRPLELNVWLPKLEFFLNKSSIAIAAIVQKAFLFKNQIEKKGCAPMIDQS